MTHARTYLVPVKHCFWLVGWLGQELVVVGHHVWAVQLCGDARRAHLKQGGKGGGAEERACVTVASAMVKRMQEKTHLWP